MTDKIVRDPEIEELAERVRNYAPPPEDKKSRERVAKFVEEWGKMPQQSPEIYSLHVGDEERAAVLWLGDLRELAKDPSVEITIEVMQKTLRDEDPSIPIYTVSITSTRWGAPSMDWGWRETYGSVEVLEGFLRGLQAGLTGARFFATLSWGRPSTWGDGGVRWVLKTGEITNREELDRDGKPVTF